MMEIILEYKTCSLFKVITEPHIIEEIHKFFSYRDPMFMMKKRMNPRLFRWNGYIHLFDKRTKCIPSGLLLRMEDFCKDNGYKLVTDSKIKKIRSHKIDHFDDFMKNLNGPFDPKDYQIDSFKYSLEKKRSIILSSTGSGKSYIIYMWIKYLLPKIKKTSKLCIIVPSTSLVHQMEKDFKDYNSIIPVHKIFSGQEKESDERVYITTWQSLLAIKDPKYFKKFEGFVWDEIHMAGNLEPKSFQKIVKLFINAHWRMGTTGTIRTEKVNILQIESYFGPIFQATTTADLQKKGVLTNVNIITHKIKYREDIVNQVDRLDWDNQQKFYEDSRNPRQKYIVELADKLKGNTLILFRAIEHGRYLEELLLMSGKKDIFYIDGSIKGIDRQQIINDLELYSYDNKVIIVGDNDKKILDEQDEIILCNGDKIKAIDITSSDCIPDFRLKKIIKKSNGAILLGSWGTMAQGVNLKNLHHVIFGASSKCTKDIDVEIEMPDDIYEKYFSEYQTL